MGNWSSFWCIRRTDQRGRARSTVRTHIRSQLTERPSAGSRGVQGLSIGNRLSSAICSPSCLSMYSRIISSVRVPELTGKYPRAQKRLPQNFFRKHEIKRYSYRKNRLAAVAGVFDRLVIAVPTGKMVTLLSGLGFCNWILEDLDCVLVLTSEMEPAVDGAPLAILKKPSPSKGCFRNCEQSFSLRY